MSTLLDEVISDLQAGGPPDSYHSDDQYQGHPQQQQQQEPDRRVGGGQRRVHFEDESDDMPLMDKIKGAFKTNELRAPLAVLFAVLLSSLPQVNDLIDKIPYVSDNWMASATFKAIVLAVVVYFLKLH